MHILRVNCAVKPFQIDQDNLQVKFAALNVYFNSANFDPPRYKESKESSVRVHMGSGYPL